MKKLLCAALFLAGCLHGPNEATGTIVSKDEHKAIIQLETGATIETLSLLNVGETVRLHYDSINEDWTE